VEVEHPVDVTLDGEIAGKLPGRFELAPEALYVVTPHSFVDIDDDVAAAPARTS
jgi:diacylglycerol kinase family enzyme